MEAPRPAYDWRELRRWGISEASLPAGSVIRFRESSFWERYRWLVVGTVLFCLFQAVMILGLLVNRAKRLQGEAEATLIANISSKFVNLPPGELDREIKDAQRRICELLGLDVSALWQWSDEAQTSLALTHLYRAQEGPPPPEQMEGAEYFPWCQQQLLAGRIITVSSLEELPAEAARDRETWSHFGVKTSLTIPLTVGGGPPLGALSFNTMRAERDWPDALVKRLQVVAQIFANALARKRADQVLRESEERMALAAEAARFGVWVWSIARNRVWGSERWRGLFGFVPGQDVSFEEVIQRIHPDDRERVEREVRRALASRSDYAGEFRALLPDGSQRWIAFRGRVTPDANGTPARMMGAAVDISEAKRAATETQGLRLQLWHADRVAQTGAITASLAHELNQPLTGILSTAQAGLRFTASGKADCALIREMLSNIVHDTKRAAGVINGLRAMLGRKETRREPIELAATIQEVLDLVHSELIGRQVQASQSLEPDLAVVADKGQIQQVLLNLVMNALEAMQDQPAEQRHLRLTLTRTETGEALVSLRDSGPGVPGGAGRSCSKRSGQLRRREWGSVWRSRGRSLNPTVGGCGLRTTRTGARRSISRCPLETPGEERTRGR